MKPEAIAAPQASGERPEGSDPSDGSRRRDTARRRRRRALVVDDDIHARELLVWCLRAAGWVVEEASDGEEALFASSVFLPHVVVIEAGVPKMDAAEVVVRLRADEATRTILVVAMGSEGAGELEVDEHRVRQAGCDAFLARPCTPEGVRDLIDGMVDAWEFIE